MVYFMRMLPFATDFFWLSVVEEWLLLLESLIAIIKRCFLACTSMGPLPALMDSNDMIYTYKLRRIYINEFRLLDFTLMISVEHTYISEWSYCNIHHKSDRNSACRQHF